MAPFLTHLVIGEQVWNGLDWQGPAQDRYGTFLFGCLAPDMDKLCDGLEQSTTHFVGKGEAALPASEQLIETMELGSFVDQATHHSLQRLHSLLAEGEIQ